VAARSLVDLDPRPRHAEQQIAAFAADRVAHFEPLVRASAQRARQRNIARCLNTDRRAEQRDLVVAVETEIIVGPCRHRGVGVYERLLARRRCWQICVADVEELAFVYLEGNLLQTLGRVAVGDDSLRRGAQQR
jgi:hypothetical protein